MAHPSTDFYMIGKGNVYWTPSGGSERHLGNCPSFAMTPEVERLDHFSSMAGVRSKDKSVVLEQSLSVEFTLDEISADNASLQLMGTVATNTAGNPEFQIFTLTELTGQLRFAGSNTVGKQVNVTLPNVEFTPTGTLQLISDEWATIDLTAEVLISGNSFGTFEQEV